MPLTLNNFLTDDEWKEADFNIPQVGDQRGIAIPVSTCSDESAKSLEFRANGSYQRFSMRAAPGTDSADSAKKLVVALFDNEVFLQSKTITYGKTDGFKDVDISSVSALKIRVYGDEESCSDASVFGVLWDISVR